MANQVKRNFILVILFVAINSCTFAAYCPRADLSGDCKVDFVDFRMFAVQWLNDPGTSADFVGNNGVGMEDFTIMAQKWLVVGAPFEISEFLASNSSEVPLESGDKLDGDGIASDWIELFNPSDATVDLTGWYLTDDDDVLSKWCFPNGLTIDSGDYLLVFASGKTQAENPGNYPYLDPAGYYHTNFSLSKDGTSSDRYLALVYPDGQSIVQQFSYPDQSADISFGGTQTNLQLVATGANASYLVPSASDNSDENIWMQESFDDSSWASSPTALGFSYTPSGAGPQTILTEDAVKKVLVQTNGDLGVSWTGGNEPFSDGGWTNYDFISGKTGGVGYDINNTYKNFVSYDIEDWIDESNTSCYIRIPFTALNPSAYTSLKLMMRYEDGFVAYINGVEVAHENAPGRDGDPGTLAWDSNATTLNPDDDAVDFEEFDISSYIGALNDGVNILAIHGLNVTGSSDLLFSPELIAEGISVASEIQTEMRYVNSSVWSRIDFEIAEDDPEAIYDALRLRMICEDGFIAYINGTEVVRSNAPAVPAWDSQSASDGPYNLAFTEFNISAYIDLLHSGSNVLAIHALNDTVSDGDFYLLPELFIASEGWGGYYLISPTPEAANTNALYVVGDTKFNNNRGFYGDPIDVEITSATAGATIRYTADGTEPTETYGTIYTAPINITGSTCLRAMAYKDGYVSTNVDTNTYIYPLDVLSQTNSQPDYPDFWTETAHCDECEDCSVSCDDADGCDTYTADYEMDPEVLSDGTWTDADGQQYGMVDALLSIPTISIVTDQNNFFDPYHGIYVNSAAIHVDDGDWERECSVELINPDGSKGFQIDCAVRSHGGQGRIPRHRKHSMRLIFKEPYGASKLNFDLFGNDSTEKFDTLVLRGGLNDSWHYEGTNSTFNIDAWTNQASREMGSPAPHGAFVHLYINGIYWGLYNPVERPDTSFAATYFGGDKDNWDVLNSGQPTNGSNANSWNAAQSVANNMVAGSISVQQGYDQLTQLVDPVSLANYMLINFFIGNGDWLGGNWYAGCSREPGSRFKFMCWDSEHGLHGVTGSASIELPYGRGNSIQRFHHVLMDHPDYRRLFADLAQKHLFNGGLLTPEANIERFEELMGQIDHAVAGESARWSDIHRGWESDPIRPSAWIARCDWLINTYFPQRTDIVIEHLRTAGVYSIEPGMHFPLIDAPNFQVNGQYQHGGQLYPLDTLEITGPGLLYYTIDGSDPFDTDNPPDNIEDTFPVEFSTNTILVPLSDIGDSWRIDPVFNDSAWKSGFGCIGFQPNPNDWPNFLPDINTNVQTEMYNINTTCYLRIPFNLDAELLPYLDTLTLKVKYDDGFVAWINGTEIASANAPGRDGNTDPLTWNSDATFSHNDEDAMVFEDFDISAFIGTLQAGDNVLAIQAMNTSVNGSDFLMSAYIEPTYIKTINTTPVTLTKSSLVRTRSYDIFNGQWSALNEAAFSVGPIADNLRVTEIMYHPAEPVTPGAYVGEDFEYIELQNTGAESINLNLVHFTDGIDYIFGDVDLPADAHIVIARNRLAFIERYGTLGINLATGEYVGSLDNNGEEIVLRDAAAAEILDFDYSDGWFAITDGAGYSITTTNAYADDPNDWDTKSGWRPSSQIDGTPGQEDAGFTLADGDVVISEILTHTDETTYGDWIELHNTTASDIYIGGWFLSDNDDLAQLEKYEIQTNDTRSLIPAGGYVVFTAVQDFRNASDPGALISFGLSELGDDTVCLSSGSNGEITGLYYTEQDYGAVENSRTIGRHTKSALSGYDIDFVRMIDNTKGTADISGPMIGPVVINEIMYNPADPDADAEFVELKNISTSTVYFYDPSNPANTWQLEIKGDDFFFPQGTSLDAGEYLLITRGDPAVFRSTYGISANVQILGPYAGSLDNGGWKLDLMMPGKPEPSDPVTGEIFVPMIKVDRVNYDDDAPWPTSADGSGMSLSRINFTSYGNDVINWQAATPTPGTANP